MSLTLPEGLERFDSSLGCRGTEIIDRVILPDSLRELDDYALGGCCLKNVAIPKGVTNIARGAFCDCAALTAILLPESLEAIGDEAFAGCAALKSIVLPKNIGVLGERVFSGCGALVDVTLPRVLTAIPDGTFVGCEALDSLVIPETVTMLGSQIVSSATKAIYYLGNAPAYESDVYALANASLVSYVVEGTKGWNGSPASQDIPKSWPTANARMIKTWMPPPSSLIVRFNANDGEGTMPPLAMEPDKVYKLPKCTLTPPKDKHFVGWACSNGKRYDDEMLVFGLGDVTMTAIWE